MASEDEIRALSLVVTTSILGLWLLDVSVGIGSPRAQGRGLSQDGCVGAPPAITDLAAGSSGLCSRVWAQGPVCSCQQVPH